MRLSAWYYCTSSGKNPHDIPMDSTNDDAQKTPDPPALADRYKARDADDGSVEIYDSKNEEAWIRSDYTLVLSRPS